MHVFVSSGNIHPLLHIKHCAAGKNLDECDPALAGRHSEWGRDGQMFTHARNGVDGSEQSRPGIALM